MITLNSDEMKVYELIINHVIPGLTPGNYKARDFFNGNPTVPRIVRRIYEETKAGNLSGLELAGRKSVDGYKVI